MARISRLELYDTKKEAEKYLRHIHPSDTMKEIRRYYTLRKVTMYHLKRKR